MRRLTVDWFAPDSSAAREMLPALATRAKRSRSSEFISGVPQDRTNGDPPCPQTLLSAKGSLNAFMEAFNSLSETQRNVDVLDFRELQKLILRFFPAHP